MSVNARNAEQVLEVLRAWDGSGVPERRRILQDFVAANKNRTGAQLDAQFADAASLFFTRLTTWLRLVYLHLSSFIEISSFMYVINIK